MARRPGVRYFEAANSTIGLVGASSGDAFGRYLSRRGESIYSVTFTVEDAGHLAGESVSAEPYLSAEAVRRTKLRTTDFSRGPDRKSASA